MLLLRNNDIKNKGIAQIIAVAVLSLIVLIGIEGAIYNNPHVSAVDNNNISYTMEFIENVVGNMPDNILDGLTSGTSSLIPSNNPIRSGFKFAGWCDQATTKNGDYDVCATGHSHQPGDTISLNQTGVNNIKLYAIWEEPMTFNKAFAAAGKSQSGGYYVMQDATPGICSAVDTGEVGDVKDSRDGTVYHIAKLADGKCWMVENLDLAGGTALSADDTDVTSDYISSFSTSNNLTKSGNTLVLPASSTSDYREYSYTFDYSSVYNSGNKTNCGASGQDIPCYSYYTWDAATLGSGRTIATENTDAPQSICPKGWKLPTSRTTSAPNWQTVSDFYVLAHQYGLDSTTFTGESGDDFYVQAGPGTTPNFLLAGTFLMGTFWFQGGIGSYWSSTYGSDTAMAHDFTFSYYFEYEGSSNDPSVGSALNDRRDLLLSVRCLFSGQ